MQKKNNLLIQIARVFCTGKSFTIRLTILQAIFQVHINGELYCTYDHSRPLNEIQYVRVKHDFEKITQFDHRALFPQTFPVQIDYDELPYMFSSDVSAPLVAGKNAKTSNSLSYQRAYLVFIS